MSSQIREQLRDLLANADVEGACVISVGALPPPVQSYGREIDRILSLPSREPLDVERNKKTGLYTPEAEALADVETVRYVLAVNEAPAHDLGRAPGTCQCAALGFPCIKRLYPSQAWFLRELRLYGGALGLVTIAGGKSIMMLLSPLAIAGCRHAVLLIKPDQKVHYIRNYAQLREHFRVPSLVFHDGMSAKKIDLPGMPTRGATVPDMPVLRVVPYSRLQRPECSELLEELNADTLLADEFHKLSDRLSRSTSRYIRYCVKKRGNITCASASGSAIKKRLEDISHISLFALGGGSPYPLDQKVEVPAWSAVVDPVTDPDLSSDTYRNLCEAFAKKKTSGQPDILDGLFGGSVGEIREGILRRVVRTPGVISTRVSESTASITFSEHRVPPMPASVARLLADVRQRGVRPDGEELREAGGASGWTQCAKDVAVGFFHYWYFFDDPAPELKAEWYAARKAWCREVRAKILEDVPKLDSENLLENAAKRFYQSPAYDGKLPTWEARTWPAWAAVKDQLRYEARSTWIDDWFAADMAEWALRHRGIVWYTSVPLGERIAKLSGLPLHGGGPHAEARILAERGDRSIVVSANAHREGRDGLQHYFHRGMIAEPMSSGDAYHQLFGRYLRPGQKEDTVEMSVPLHVVEHKNALRSAFRLAEFDAGMNPNSQLLLAADCDEGVEACR